MNIKTIPQRERPREKALQNGIAVLSNNELLAILLKNGTPNKNALELAAEIITCADGIGNLSQLTLLQLQQLKGIGPVKALTLQACFELSRRINYDQLVLTTIKITSPYIAYQWFGSVIAHLPFEQLLVIILSSKNQVLTVRTIGNGYSASVIFNQRALIEILIAARAQRFLCLHNHPSGDPEPSAADLNTTKKMLQISTMLEMEMIDHLIVTLDQCYSIFLKMIIAPPHRFESAIK